MIKAIKIFHYVSTIPKLALCKFKIYIFAVTHIYNMEISILVSTVYFNTLKKYIFLIRKIKQQNNYTNIFLFIAFKMLNEKLSINKITTNYPWIVNSEMFQLILRDYGESDEDLKQEFTVPICSEDEKDLHLLINVINFWGVQFYSEKICKTLQEANKTELINVLEQYKVQSNENNGNNKLNNDEYGQFTPFVDKLLFFVNYNDNLPQNAAYKGYIDIFNYLEKCGYKIPDDICSYAAISENPKMIEFLHDEKGYKIDEDTFQMAVVWKILEISKRLEILKYLHKKGCPYKNDVFIYAARTDNVNVLDFLHKNGYPWDQNAFKEAVENAYLESLKYFHDNGCPTIPDSCTLAAKKGHLNILKFLHESGYPWNDSTFEQAIINNHLECLKYLHVNNCPLINGACNMVAARDFIDILKYLHKNGYPWDEWTFQNAFINRSLNCLKYLIENNCPYPNDIYLSVIALNYFDVLKILHENGIPWNETVFEYAVWEERLEMVKYLHDNGCPSDKNICENAIRLRKYSIFEFLVNNDYPINEETFQSSLYSDDLNYIKLLHDKKCPFNKDIFKKVIRSKSDKYPVFEFLVNNDYPFDEGTFEDALYNDDLKYIKLLHNNNCRFNKDICEKAIRLKKYNAFKFLVENNYPIDEETFEYASYSNDVKYVEILHNNKCHFNKNVLKDVIRWNNFEVFKFLIEKSYPFNEQTFEYALFCDIKYLKILHNLGCPYNNHILSTCIRHNKMEQFLYLLDNSYPCDENTFEVAISFENIEYLKILHERGCPHKKNVCDLAVDLSKTEKLQFLVENGYEFGPKTFEKAVISNDLKSVECLDKNNCVWKKNICSFAIRNLEILEYLHQNGYTCDEDTCDAASCAGQLKSLKYLHEHGCPWDKRTCSNAAEYGHLDCLKYAHEHGCPCDEYVCFVIKTSKNPEIVKYGKTMGCR